MLSTLVLLEFASLFFGRVGLELWLPCKHESTPGRVVSSFHGVFVLSMIYFGLWKDAIDSTLLYFYFDLLFTIKLTPEEDRFTMKTLSMILHHLLGFCLCLYSSWTKSYEIQNLASRVTRGLILLEVCNPLLHLAMLAKLEDIKLLNYFDHQINVGMLLNYFYVRVWLLGNSLYVGNEEKELLRFYSTPPVTYFYVMSLALWFLQVGWFCHLCSSFIKKSLKND
jgi:hypothetical protein